MSAGKPEDMRPSPKPHELAKDLLRQWGVAAPPNEVNRLEKALVRLSLNYSEYLDAHENALELPSLTAIAGTLVKVAHAASELEDALKQAKDLYPDFMRNHLSPLVDLDILNELSTEPNIDDTRFVRSLYILFLTAQNQVNILAEAGSSPNYSSFLFGHPTMRMLMDCLFVLEIQQIEKPLNKVVDIAEIVQLLTNPKMCKIPGLSESLPTIIKWWKAEGRELWMPLLMRDAQSESDYSPDIKSRWTEASQAAIYRILKMSENNDRGQFGGVYPDSRLLRKKKDGKA